MTKNQPFKRLNQFYALLQAFNLSKVGPSAPPTWRESKGKGRGKHPHKVGRHGAHTDAVRAARKQHNVNMRR